MPGMIWALFLFGLAVLLGVVAAALSALPPRPARHRVPETPERWAPSLGPGWVLRMDGTAEYAPRGRPYRPSAAGTATPSAARVASHRG